jgi:heme exporter protein D
MSEFFAMGGYGFYVWTAYGVTALVIAIELVTLRTRRHTAIEEASLSGPDTKEMPAFEPAGEPK